MAKKRLGTGYTFTAASKTITHADFSDITLAGIQLIVNVTDQIIIYNFADTTKGGTLATDTLTLEYDTTSMSDTDELMILVEDGVAAQPISASSLPLPTGASTSANQTTIIGHLDGVEGLLTTIDADTGNISTKIDTIAGAVSGTEVQVDVLTMPTTTVQATNLDIRDLTNTSDSVAIYGSDDGGTTKRIIKTDAGGAIQVDLEVASVAITSIAAGDNNIGNVDIVSSALPTGASTLAEQQTQTTHLSTIAGDTTSIQTAVELIDDTVAVLGTDTYTEATSKGLVIGAVRRDADTTLVNTTNEYTPLQVDANGRLKVEAFSGETLPVSLASVPSHDVTNAGTFAVQVNGSALTALQLIDDTVFTAGTDTYTETTSKGNLLLAVRRDADTTLANTTNEFTPLQVDANGYLKVEVFDGGGTHTVDAPVGTPVNVQIGNATLVAGVIDETGASAVDALAVGGGTASDAVDSGNPIKIGMKAYELDGTAPQTAVAEADRVNAISDLVGRQYVATEHPRFWHVSVDYASAQTNATIKAAPGASLALYITDIMISNGATAGNITLLDGSGGTVLFELYPAVNGGVALNLKNPIKLTDNTLLAITSTTVTTHSVFVSGFID